MNSSVQFIETLDAKEFATFLFFNLSRKINNTDIEIIYKRLHKILCFLKTRIISEQCHIRKEEIAQNLDMLIKLVLYTRDRESGLDERKLAFAQLCCWYSVFPRQTIDIIRLFLLGDPDHTPFGAWGDVKILCSYIKDEHPEAYPFINTILTIVHNRTVFFTERIIHAIRDDNSKPTYSVVTELSACIPPESSKKYKWIFNILAEKWGDYLFNYVNSNYRSYSTTVKRANKYKMEYRHTIQLLKKYKENLYANTETIEALTNRHELDDTLIIPFVDVSTFSSKNNNLKLHKHIDIIKNISNHAPIHNIICVDNTVSVIDTRNIEFDLSSIVGRAYPDYFKAIDLVLDGIQTCGLTEQNTKLIKLIFVSNIGTTETKPVDIYNYIESAYKSKFYGKPLPIIVFWNNSDENTPYFSNANFDSHYIKQPGENIVFKNNIIFVSGLSAFSKHVLNPRVKNTTALIAHILKEPRYNIKYTPF